MGIQFRDSDDLCDHVGEVGGTWQENSAERNDRKRELSGGHFCAFGPDTVLASVLRYKFLWKATPGCVLYDVGIKMYMIEIMEAPAGIICRR